MAWTYSDYVTQTTYALRASRLRLHIQEVSDKVTAALTSQTGDGYDPDALQKYLDSLFEQLEKMGGAATADDPSVTSAFTRGRPIGWGASG